MTLDRAVMPSAGPAPSFAPPRPIRRTLSNGLSILVVEKPELPMVALGLLVRAGSVSDPTDGPGLTSLTAAMLTEGTTSRSSQQISDEMEHMGSAIQIKVRQEYTVLSAQALEPHWRQALAVLADVARNPSFPAADLERIRRQRLTDLARISDDPSAVAQRACRALLYGRRSAYGHPGTGTEVSIDSFSRDDLRVQYTGAFGPADGTLVVAGQVAADDVTEIAESLLGGWRAQGGLTISEPCDIDSDSRPEAAIYLSDRPGAAQSVIRSGQTLVGRHSPDFMALVVLNQVLGGEFSARLNMNLRQDKGYSYGYMSTIDWLRGPSALYAGGSVQTSVTKEAVEESLKEYSEIRRQRPVEQWEHDDAVKGLLRGFPASFETQGQIAAQLVQLASFDLPDDYLSHLPDMLLSVTLDDVREVALERLRQQPEVVLVVGDRDAIEPGLSTLGPTVIPVDAEGRRLN